LNIIKEIRNKLITSRSKEPFIGLGSIEDATRNVVSTDMQNPQTAMRTNRAKGLEEGQPTIS